jgi:hypothetical protein
LNQWQLFLPDAGNGGSCTVDFFRV